MLLGIAVTLIGVLIAIWGICNIINVSKHNKGAFNLLDILINGSGSGLGMVVGGIIFSIIGIVIMFGK